MPKQPGTKEKTASKAVELRQAETPVVRGEELTVDDLVGQVEKIQEAMSRVMQEGVHYGVIPGTQKPSLFKPGAEKLCLLFRLDAEYEILASETQDDYINYTVKCTLFNINSGKRAGSGIGSCNSKEKRYRKQAPRDVDNTLLKMAQKRALVAAVLNATGASDIFTQDTEDMRPTNNRTSAPPISSETASALIEALADLDYDERWAPDLVLMNATRRFGRTITSFSELTENEALVILEGARVWREQHPPEEEIEVIEPEAEEYESVGDAQDLSLSDLSENG